VAPTALRCRRTGSLGVRPRQVELIAHWRRELPLRWAARHDIVAPCYAQTKRLGMSRDINRASDYLPALRMGGDGAGAKFDAHSALTPRVHRTTAHARRAARIISIFILLCLLFFSFIGIGDVFIDLHAFLLI
jgi:hypothetical protein